MRHEDRRLWWPQTWLHTPISFPSCSLWNSSSDDPLCYKEEKLRHDGSSQGWFRLRLPWIQETDIRSRCTYHSTKRLYFCSFCLGIISTDVLLTGIIDFTLSHYHILTGHVYIYVSLQLCVENAVSAQPCVGKFRISLVLLNFLHCNFRLWFKTQ